VAIEGRIDDLIEAGWWVLESDFDPVAFERWRRSAFDCLTPCFGRIMFTRHFDKFAPSKSGKDRPSCRRRHTERSQKGMARQQKGLNRQS